jgi:soluble lytic murein transglycosylase-like protein
MGSVHALKFHEFAGRMAIFAMASVFACAGCGRSPSPTRTPVSREQVWQAIQPLAARYRMDPKFIYALVAAESNFDASAQNGDARGLLQLKEGAWQTVNTDPYEPGVWDWRRNLESGVDYLAWCRSYLHQKQNFSYPLLLASFHYGIDHVRERSFDLRRLDPPDSVIYRELWGGNFSPVSPPKTEIPR